MTAKPTTQLNRRRLLRGVLTAAAVAGGGAARGAAATRGTQDGTWARVRRVVTGEDAAGRGVVLFDGEPANVLVMNGTRIMRLWETGEVPVPLPLRADAGATAGNAYREGFRGSSLYVAELPGGKRAPSIPMHKNATVDYMAILSGRIIMKLDTQEVLLRAGDVIIQGGSNHTWINRWREPCLLLFVVLPAYARS